MQNNSPRCVLNRDSDACVFLRMLWNFSKQPFYRASPGNCFLHENVCEIYSEFYKFTTPLSKKSGIFIVHIDQVCFNTRVPTQVNTNQHESTRVQHESTRFRHESTRINTNQHDFNTSQHESTRFRHESDMSRHESTRVWHELIRPRNHHGLS